MSLGSKRLFLVCTGLGQVQRGFETYVQDLAEKLGSLPDFASNQLTVLSSAKVNIPGTKNIIVPCIKRNSPLWPKKISNQTRFYIEQSTFFLGMIVLLFRNRNAVFYLGEYTLYCYIFKLRNLLKFKQHLVLYTGGQVFPGLFNVSKDFIHHVTNIYLKDGNNNYPLERQFLLPHFVKEDYLFDQDQFEAIKQKASGKQIFLSVGVVDSSTKQMDVFLQMLSEYKDKVFPIILGDKSPETPSILTLAINLFGHDGFIVDCVDRKCLNVYYSVADCFVLLSQKESFGLAYLEALLRGKPVIARKFEESTYVLGNAARLVANDGECKKAIQKVVSEGMVYTQCHIPTHQYVIHKYSWTYLKPLYINMFKRFCA